jgi:hypothetical protein
MLPILVRLILALLLSVFVVTAADFNSDGSQSDTQSKINSASDGDRVILPSGNFTWTSGVTVSAKGIHIQGGGAGRVLATSPTSVTVGTGTKVFTVDHAWGNAIIGGQTLTITRTGSVNGSSSGAQAEMTGTVTSYSSGTLTMNITSTVGSGTHTVWFIRSQHTTTITQNGSAVLFEVTEDATHNVEISDFAILEGSGTGHSIRISRETGGEPVLVHDMYILTDV